MVKERTVMDDYWATVEAARRGDRLTDAQVGLLIGAGLVTAGAYGLSLETRESIAAPVRRFLDSFTTTPEPPDA